MSTEQRGGGKEANAAEYGKTASFLAIGVGLTGLITYAYFLIASHTLDAHDYGQIAVLWSAAVVMSPVSAAIPLHRRIRSLLFSATYRLPSVPKAMPAGVSRPPLAGRTKFAAVPWNCPPVEPW